MKKIKRKPLQTKFQFNSVRWKWDHNWGIRFRIWWIFHSINVIRFVLFTHMHIAFYSRNFRFKFKGQFTCFTSLLFFSVYSLNINHQLIQTVRLFCWCQFRNIYLQIYGSITYTSDAHAHAHTPEFSHLTITTITNCAATEIVWFCMTILHHFYFVLNVCPWEWERTSGKEGNRDRKNSLTNTHTNACTYIVQWHRKKEFFTLCRYKYNFICMLVAECLAHMRIFYYGMYSLWRTITHTHTYSYGMRKICQ